MLTNFAATRAAIDQDLPGAFFSNAASYLEFAPARRRYEAAVQAYAVETSPAALRQYVAMLRRYGIRATEADAQEAAVCGLRESLSALGYTEADVEWHAARRGRRDRAYFVKLH